MNCMDQKETWTGRPSYQPADQKKPRAVRSTGHAACVTADLPSVGVSLGWLFLSQINIYSAGINGVVTVLVQQQAWKL
jgi:hypothetical protein